LVGSSVIRGERRFRPNGPGCFFEGRGSSDQRAKKRVGGGSRALHYRLPARPGPGRDDRRRRGGIFRSAYNAPGGTSSSGTPGTGSGTADDSRSWPGARQNDHREFSMGLRYSGSGDIRVRYNFMCNAVILRTSSILQHQQLVGLADAANRPVIAAQILDSELP
jgi:hypothetical protein